MLVAWYENCKKIIFLKSNGWERCGDYWKYKHVIRAKKLMTIDEAVECEKKYTSL